MKDIWIGTDFHLRGANDSRHPYRALGQLEKLVETCKSNIGSDDLFIFLGDLCDPEFAKLDELAVIIQSIPCRKIMCRGNHDTMDDGYYMMIGFDDVADIYRYHNILFSHKPIRVAPDEVNVHGHLHTAKMNAHDANHINAYATGEKINPDGTAEHWPSIVLLDDVIDAASVQELGVDEKIQEHLTEKFEKYTSIDHDHYNRIVDITPAVDITEEPIDETVINNPTIEDVISLCLWMNKKFDYKIVTKKDIFGFPDTRAVDCGDFTNYRIADAGQFEFQGGGTCWDYVVYEATLFKKCFPTIPYKTWFVQYDNKADNPTHTFLTFSLDGKYYYFENAFRPYAGVYEVDSESDAVSFVLAAMSDTPSPPIKPGELLQKYPYYVWTYNATDWRIPGMNAPRFMDFILKHGTHIKNFKYKKPKRIVQLAIVNESTDDPMDEILFPDIDSTKYFMADDDAYEKVARRAKQQREDTTVAIDESLTSVVEKDYTPKGHMNLSQFKSKELTEADRKKLSQKYKFLRHFYSTDESHKVIIWMDGEELVAAIGVSYPDKMSNPGKWAGHNWIDSFEITSDYKGYGLSKQIMKYAIGTLHADALGVAKDNKLAQKVYRDMGFRYGGDTNGNNFIMYLTEDASEGIPLSQMFSTNQSITLLHESIISNGILYHGSDISFDIIQPNECGAYPGQKVIFATPYYPFAVAFAGKRWTDLVINQCMVNGEMVLTEIVPDAFDKIFDCGGYVYEVPATDFTQMPDHKSEYICDHPVEVLEKHHIPNVLKELKRCGVKMYKYPSLPRHIKERDAYIAEKKQQYGITESSALANTMYDYPLYYMNTKQWNTKQHRVLYVTGCSSSGKSTLAHSLQKTAAENGQKVEVISLDYMAKAIIRGRKHLNSVKKYVGDVDPVNTDAPHEMDFEYMNTHPEVQFNGKDIFNKLYDYIRWIDNEAQTNPKYKKTLFIVEGYQLAECVGYHDDMLEFLRQRPVIVVDRSNNQIRKNRLTRLIAQYREYNQNPIKDIPFILSYLTFDVIDDVKPIREFKKELRPIHESAGKCPPVTATEEKRDNPNDHDSPTGVKLTFFDTNKNKVGEASISAIDTPNGFLYDVEVFEKYRGQGYGNSIMQYVLKHYKVTELTVEKGNTVAMSLYKKFGFRKEIDFKENGKDMIDMRKGYVQKAVAESTITEVEEDPVLKKYGLRDVGNTHDVEDEEERIRQRKEQEKRMDDLHKSAKKKREELKKRKQKRLGYLKKARRVKKRKRRIRQLKSLIPGVKNEDINALYENPASANIDTSILPESVIEPIDTIQFFDRMDEAATKSQKLEPVYVILMHTGTPMSKVIKGVIHTEFTHSSIAFDSSLRKMYTFSSRRRNPEKLSPLQMGGFTEEDIRDEFFSGRPVHYTVYMVPCFKDQVKLMKKRLQYFLDNDIKFSYDKIGLVQNLVGMDKEAKDQWFCSEFVADILKTGKPNTTYIDSPFRVRPMDFSKMGFAVKVYEGETFDTYDKKAVDRKVKLLLNQKKMVKLANESVLDIPRENLYEDAILNYQLTMMDEAALEDFMSYMKSFKVRFDNNGNIIVTRREYDQLDAHFKQSIKMIKAFEEAGNVEGVKDELCKIHYMIQLVNEYYLKPNSRNLREGSKDVRKDMMDLRSVMMNVFKQHLTWVTIQEPNWNFNTYYDGSKYGKDLVLPKKMITTVGRTVITAL